MPLHWLDVTTFRPRGTTHPAPAPLADPPGYDSAMPADLYCLGGDPATREQWEAGLRQAAIVEELEREGIDRVDDDSP